MHKKVNDIIRTLAKKHGLSIKETEKIVKTPWRVMQEVVKETDPLTTPLDDLPAFKHINLGQFGYSRKKVTNMKNKENGGKKSKN